MQKIVNLRCKRKEFKACLADASIRYNGKFEISAILRNHPNLLPDEIYIVIHLL